MVKEYAGLTSVNVREVNRSFETLDKAERGIQLLTQELTTPPMKKERKRKSQNILEPVRKRKYERVNKQWRISFIDKLTELCNDESHAAYIKWSVPNSIISFIPDKFQDNYLRNTSLPKMPICTKNWPSFLRQLNLHGFKKIRSARGAKKVKSDWVSYYQVDLGGNRCTIGHREYEARNQWEVDYAHNPYISPYSLSSYQCPDVCQLPIETTLGYDENKENNWPSLIWQTPVQIDSGTSEVDTENLTDHLISLAH